MRWIQLALAAAFVVMLAGCGSTAVDYGEGVQLRSGADVDKLAGAPTGFKQYIAGLADATAAGGNPKDKCSPRVFVDRVDGTFARGGVFDCGGAQLMWARGKGGIWRQIWGGQITPDCPTMRRHSVPKSIVGKVCWNVKTQKEEPYP